MKTTNQFLNFRAIIFFSVLILFSCNPFAAKKESPNESYNDSAAVGEREYQKEIEKEKEKQKAQIQTYIQAINNVLNTDSEMKNTYYNSTDYTLYTSQMRTINTYECPRDFATGFIEHIQAWEDAAKVKQQQEELKKHGDLAVAAGFIATITKSEASPFSNYLQAETELNNLAIEKSNEILRTWKIIERLTISYGGTLPQ